MSSYGGSRKRQRVKLTALAILAIMALTLAVYALLKPSGEGPPHIISEIMNSGPRL